MPGPGQRLRAIEERLDIVEANQAERYMDEEGNEVERYLDDTQTEPGLAREQLEK